MPACLLHKVLCRNKSGPASLVHKVVVEIQAAKSGLQVREWEFGSLSLVHNGLDSNKSGSANLVHKFVVVNPGRQVLFTRS